MNSFISSLSSHVAYQWNTLGWAQHTFTGYRVRLDTATFFSYFTLSQQPLKNRLCKTRHHQKGCGQSNVETKLPQAGTEDVQEMYCFVFPKTFKISHDVCL